MADHVHRRDVCGFGNHNPHDPSCARMHGRMIACGTIVDPTHPHFGKVLCRHKDAPPWNPAKWNNKPKIKVANNCYNYACDWPTGTFAQPGAASGFVPTAVDCNQYGTGAVKDGLSEIDCDKPCPIGCWKVALVIDLAYPDFHWYRQDDDGNWSHKPGATDATNKDASGNPISDPRRADRDYSSVGGPNYTTFCACFCVCPPITIASADGLVHEGEIAMLNQRPHVLATCLLFSGRDNPSWEISKQDIQEAKKRLSSLSAARSIPLKWRGFVLRNQHVPDFPDVVIVHDGIIEIMIGEKLSCYRDDRGMSEWLKKKALASDQGELIKRYIS